MEMNKHKKHSDKNENKIRITVSFDLPKNCVTLFSIVSLKCERAN